MGRGTRQSGSLRSFQTDLRGARNQQFEYLPLGPLVANLALVEDDAHKRELAKAIVLEARKQERTAIKQRLIQLRFPDPDIADKVQDVTGFAAEDLLNYVEKHKGDQTFGIAATILREQVAVEIMSGIVDRTGNQDFWVQALNRVDHNRYLIAEASARPLMAVILPNNRRSSPEYYAKGLAEREDVRQRYFSHILSKSSSYSRWDENLSMLLQESQGVRRFIDTNVVPLAGAAFVSDS